MEDTRVKMLLGEIDKLRARVDALETERDENRAALATIGEWMKALASNDLKILEIIAFKSSRDGDAPDRVSANIDFLFQFRNDMDEKIKTDG